jgi:ubiquinone/menaquinone biosynthesis C-methylase UbiE
MSSATPEVERTWDIVAPVYDQLTAAHDHAAWAEQLETLALAAGLTGRRLLDVGCGTGSSSAAMIARGYEVVGVDVSPGMLELAARRLGTGVPLHHHDMRRLPRLGMFDVVWSDSDAINFLLSDTDLVKTFTGFRRNLAPGGLVVFDVDTLAAFRTLYSSLLVVPGAERVVVFEGRARDGVESGAIAEASIDALEPTTPPWWRRVRAVHRQRHHSPATLTAALTEAGLEPVAIWGTDGAGGSDRPLDEERHNKAVYIARLAAPS